MKKYDLNLKLIHSNELKHIKITFESEDNNEWRVETQNIKGKFEKKFNLGDIFDLKDYETKENFLNELFEYIHLDNYPDFDYEYLYNTKKLLIKFFERMYQIENKGCENSDGLIKEYNENEFKELMKSIQEYQHKSVEKINELDKKFI
ncbi:hypothetical protein [Leptotrichia wadei]|jgi:hypothetical protein|uniref:hypothetical protein n=1 Tax=Leptotrichia wadei TaxID=157687 RepID=UPI0028E556FE|nr:hypothetical protein [Leptotrichia wadei]